MGSRVDHFDITSLHIPYGISGWKIEIIDEFLPWCPEAVPLINKFTDALAKSKMPSPCDGDGYFIFYTLKFISQHNQDSLGGKNVVIDSIKEACDSLFQEDMSIEMLAAIILCRTVEANRTTEKEMKEWFPNKIIELVECRIKTIV
jgi:hypothetical protein